MGASRIRRLIPAVAVAAVVTALATPAASASSARSGTSAASASSASSAAKAAEPAEPAVGTPGTVPGLTGPAARAAAGAAADHFKQLTTSRVTKAAAAQAVSPAAVLHTDWGLNLPNSASSGLHATQSVVAGATATNGGDYVYSPTALPASGACIEITTAYTPSGPDLWAWDWCGGRDSVGKLTPLDSTFVSTYTTTVNGHPAYNLDEHKTSTTANTWTAYLYNFKTQAWDTFYTSTGTFDLPQYPFGWDMFEVYTSVNPATGAGYYCQDMNGKIFESSGIQVQTGSSWVAASSANSSWDSNPPVSGSSLDCPALTFSIKHANDDWAGQIGGTTPPPSNSYEAESSANTLGGQAAVRASSGASGGELVGYIGNGSANYLQFNGVNVTSAGSHTITVYYAAGSARSVSVSADGGAAVTVSTPSTGGWDTIGSVSVTVTLNAGSNTLRFGNTTAWAPDLDRIVVS